MCTHPSYRQIYTLNSQMKVRQKNRIKIKQPDVWQDFGFFFIVKILTMNIFSFVTVSALQARTFATWTLTSCLLCLICARNPCIPAIYGATLGSFLIALVHFLLELLAYKTVGLKTAIQPMIVAGVSSLWMIAGWNYYTAFAPHAEPT
jgi:hypothetical protein